MNILNPLYKYLVLLIWILQCGCSTTHTSNDSILAFAKLYGFVKYFHPSDEAAYLDWDRFAYYGVKKVKNAESQEQLRKILEHLFLPIAPSLKIFRANEARPFTKESGSLDTNALDFVFWQHQGHQPYKKGPQQYSPFKSVRVNASPVRGNNPPMQGKLIQQLSLDIEEGEYRLSAYLKADVGSGSFGQLWLSGINNTRNTFSFESAPITTDKWRIVELDFAIDGKVALVQFGSILNGTGKVWADSFQLLEKDSAGGWEAIEVSNPGFETINQSDSLTGWDWSGSSYSLKRTGENPFHQSYSVLLESNEKNRKIYEHSPKPREFVIKSLGAGLLCQLPLSLYRGTNGTLPQANADSFRFLKENLNKIDLQKVSCRDIYTQLANIAIAWNTFQHFYPYFDVVTCDWDLELERAMERSLAGLTAEGFYLSLSKMLAPLQDGHIRLNQPFRRKNIGALPFNLEWIEEKLVVISSQDSSKVNAGDIIVSIDGVSANNALLTREELISGSKQARRLAAVKAFGTGASQSTANLIVRRNKQEFALAVPRVFPKTRFQKPNVDLDLPAPDVYYINLETITFAKFKQHLDQFYKARGLVFDLRGYCQITPKFLTYLMTENDTCDTWLQIPQFIYPDQEKMVGYKKSGWHLKAQPARFPGKIVFLTDANAISYSESLLSIVEHYGLAEIVGQPTAGANGDVNKFLLLGQMSISWTGLRVVKLDGSQNHLFGVQPNTRVERTIEGVVAGKDEYLEKAVEIILAL